MLEKISLYDGIQSLLELASADGPAERDLSFAAGEVAELTNDQVRCFSIKQIIPKSVFQNACAKVKHKMLQALVELESKYGNLDTLGIDISGKKPEQVAADNADINRTVLNINIPVPEPLKEKMPSKIAWKIIIPIITGAIGAILGAVAVRFFGLG